MPGSAFSPDGTTLVIGHQDGRTALWDVSTGRIQQVLSGHTDFIASLVFSPDGMTLASSSADRSVRLWDLPGGHPRFIIHNQTNTVSVLAFSPNGRFLILGNYASPTIQLWDVITHCERMVLKGLKSNLVAVTVSQDSLTLAAADFHGVITFWDLQTLEIVPGGLRDARVFALAFAPGGGVLATGGFDGTIELWDWPYGSPGNRPQRISATVSPVQVQPTVQQLRECAFGSMPRQSWSRAVQGHGITRLINPNHINERATTARKSAIDSS